jgi:hypothetical protein
LPCGKRHGGTIGGGCIRRRISFLEGLAGVLRRRDQSLGHRDSIVLSRMSIRPVLGEERSAVARERWMERVMIMVVLRMNGNVGPSGGKEVW